MSADHRARRIRARLAIASFSIFAALATFIGAIQNAFANEYGLYDFTIHQHYVSPRALGMGNAFTAVADDYSTLFYNPAGLARLEEGQVNLGLGVALDTKTLDLKSDIDEVSGNDDIGEMVELLEKNYGNHYSARLPTVNAIWARPKWGFAFIPADLSIEMEIHQLAAASLNVIATQDSTIAYGRGWDLKWLGKDRLSFGITGKAIYRLYYNKALLASDLVFDNDIFKTDDAAEGFTFDADMGLLWTPHISSRSWWRWTKPTVGLTVRNVADYGFVSNFHLLDDNSKEPPRLYRRFDLGTKFELPDWWVWKTRFMADMRDMGHPNYTFQKGLHLGAEFLWKMRSWWQGGWRVGLNQGYFTAGFTGKVGIFNLDIATYAEEVGPSDAPKSNRRYVAKMSFDW